MMGKTISHYKITEKIGAGGMGIVYKAEDTKLKRTVALKFLPAELTRDQEAKKRFLHEAQAASALDHPNICNIFEIDESEDGQIFMAMAFYKGQTLKDKIASGPLPIEEAINIAIQTAEGLNKAHKKDIVHRDIKSANIMVTDEGVVKILDFGLAKLRGVTKLTKEGTTLGTVAYMSPEQVTGEKTDQRSDIWSLGVILYEMVTGQTPFKGEYEQSIMYSIMNEKPEPVTGLRTGIPLQLEQIIDKTLSKNPMQRYQHMDELKVDLQRLKKQPDQKIISPKPGKTHRVRTYLIPIIILAGIILALMLTSILKKTAPEPKRKMLVVLPFENLGHPDDEYFTAGMHEEITTRLAMIRNLRVISRASAMKFAKTNKTIKEIGRELGVQYILKGTVRWARSKNDSEKIRISTHLINAVDDTHIWADTYDRVINDIFQVQSEIAHKVVGKLNISIEKTEHRAIDISHTDNMEAYHAFLKAKYLIEQPHFTQKMWPEVIRNYEQAVELDPEYALAWAELARAHARLVFFSLDLSEERKEKARKAAEKAIKLNPGHPQIHLSLSYYYLWMTRDTQRALEELEIAQGSLPNNTSIMDAKANIYEVQGQFREIINIMKKAHELNPLSTSILLKLALAYWFTREYLEGKKVVDQAITLDPGEAWAHLYKVVLFWSWRGAIPEAREAIKETRPSHSWVPYVWFWQEIGERKFQQAIDRLTASHEEWINTKIFKIPISQAYAYLYEFMGQTNKSRQYYLEAKKILENEIKKTPNDPRLHSSLGITLASLDEKQKAIQATKQATKILPISKDAVYGTPFIHDMALIYTILGEYKLALDQIEYLLLKIPSSLSPAYLKLDPRWSRVKNLPRYKKIIQEYRKRFPY